MSRENLEALTRLHRARATGDWDTVLAMYSPDTIWDDRKLRPDGAIHRGRDAMRAQMVRWFATWDRYSVTVEEELDAGDRVVTIGREQGIAKTSGVEIDHRFALVHAFEEGLIVETTVYGDPHEALEAVGLHRLGNN
jgi:ketosteroid isomerase-like protein